jgi:hypothetical protein
MTLPDFTITSYEMLLSLLRMAVAPHIRERLKAELRSRDRAMYNQWAQVNGGEFK